MSPTPPPICTTEWMWADGTQAVWIWSEFDVSEATIDQMARWADPRNWARTEGLFKSVTPIGDPPPDGATAWYRAFREVVQLASGGKEIAIPLACSFKQGETYVSLTYQLTRLLAAAIDPEVVVDRGFLLATNVGDTTWHCKAVKLVGFNVDTLNQQSLSVCGTDGAWTTWLKQSVLDMIGQSPNPSKYQSTNGVPGDNTPEIVLASLRDWISSRAQDWYGVYSTQWISVASRIATGQYQVSDLGPDSAWLFTQIARDWANSWQDLNAAARMLSTEVPPTASAAGIPHITGPPAWLAHVEGVAIPLVPGTPPTATLVSSDLTNLTQDPTQLNQPPKIPSSAITLRPEPVSGGPGVVLTTNTDGVPLGLYQGSIRATATGFDTTVPVFFYVSQAYPVST